MNIELILGNKHNTFFSQLQKSEISWKLPMKFSSMLIEVYVFSENQENSAKSRLNSDKVSSIDESEFS